ncbi:class I SAM-dependent methyltransferase [Wenyingzhuangia marina]|uniref:Methyltransferase domain-containing protein n=1 Tax=Wenyingzhuangia marina TaxID=1195760 RepID=A0A1M5V8P9_9FLAO|nr:SAM-dependent methyltransferase [Wenyingzhuangia marina]GGF73839.1 methyltransferase [Wenyingzhuangia marina]SHH71313.1 Methyltransferase domain-containing protein [Wenyingzhuangia marina]
MEEFKNLFEEIQSSIVADTFVKMTFSKPIRKNDGLRNVYVRLVTIQDQQKFQFTYRNKTNDVVKNFSMEETLEQIEDLLMNTFRAAVVFTLPDDIQVFVSKKKAVTLKKVAPSFTNKLPETHDRPKEKRAANREYLFHLGVTDKDGNVIPKMADKYRQINKYLEIIESLINGVKLPKKIQIVDMGSGKGYLTFALYDYLKNDRHKEVSVTGIELRDGLVKYCNDVAKKCGFEDLQFENKLIQDYDNKKIDILIALHACDTATDDAIAKGIVANASLVICAPCCHKQVRQQLKGTEQESPILKYGIFKERQFEMITDTIRALIMEKHQYSTKVFEFISNEHTRKNVMLVGSKTSKKVDTKDINNKIKDLKNQYHIDFHYLEKQL